MAAAVNNIAATFAAASSEAPATSSYSSSSSSPSLSSATPPRTVSAAFSLSDVRPISASWIPHTALPRSQRSSFLALYGLPGPRPRPFLSRQRPTVPPAAIAVGERLPDATLSYLDRAGAVRAVSVSELTRGRKAVIMSVPGAFTPALRSRWWYGGGATFALSPEELVKKAGVMKQRGGGGGEVVVACVAANDVYVMRAWGEQLGAAEGGVMMLSEPDAELARALGLGLDLRGGVEGFGVRSEGYLMVAVNGIVRALFRNHPDSACIGFAGIGKAVGDAASGFDQVLQML